MRENEKGGQIAEKKIIFHYTDGKTAKVGDRVKFSKSYGYAGQHTMKAEGTIKNLDHLYGQVQIDISPSTYREDMGRFGTRETSIFTIHAEYDSSKPVTEKNGVRTYHYVITKPHAAWSLDVLCQFNDSIEKI